MAEINPDSKCCSVCIDTYITPRMLPCGHSFCSGCLQRILDAGCVNCPTCREPFPCHEIHRFPVNYALMAAIGETTATDLSQIKKVCPVHDLPKKFFCRGDDCYILVCKKCWSNKHAKTPHCVVPVEETETGGNSDVRSSDSVLSYQNSDKFLADQLSEANLKATAALQQATFVREKLRDFGIGSDGDEKQIKTLPCKIGKEQDSREAAGNLATKSNFGCAKSNPKSALKIANEVVSKKIGDMEKTLKNCLIVDRAAVDFSAEQIFMLDTSRKMFFVFDFQLCLKHNFNFEAGEVLDFALNGDGTFYVSYVRDEQFMTSAVNKKDGLVLREIHSDKRSVGLLKAFNNNIFIVFVDELDQKQILMFTNEKLTKTIDLSKDIYSVHFVAPDYTLYRKSTKRNEFVVEKIRSTKTSKKCVETDDDNYASGSVWVPKKSSVESASGYLVISTYMKCLNEVPDIYEVPDLKVYDFDLATVRDGATKLESIKFSLNSKEKCEQIYFYSSLGPESILCRMRTKNGDEKIAVLKLEFY
ncbi:uncharacterized protein LOC142346066 isoform X2 [Convolutriloba macropyga]|uniref:uncharacterized protein LOC142346066 isoform X2 n=1 Tax=Convolutriloba macropyga TaxID=536237 RepID=UPI003F5268A5